MLPHRKGPSAIEEDSSTFFTETWNRQYPPAASIPSTKTIRSVCQPRTKPPTAISLISPPPMLPGKKIAIAKSAPLTRRAPMIRPGMEISRKIKSESTPNPAIMIRCRFEMICCRMSESAIRIRTVRNAADHKRRGNA